MALTLDEFTRPQPTYFSWPNAPGAGALVLLALVMAAWWLVRDTRQELRANAWAKSALALVATIPLGWIATAHIVSRKLTGIPDGDMPPGLSDLMNLDVDQMQYVALAVTLSALACIVMSARQSLSGGANTAH